MFKRVTFSIADYDYEEPTWAWYKAGTIEPVSEKAPKFVQELADFLEEYGSLFQDAISDLKTTPETKLSFHIQEAKDDRIWGLYGGDDQPEPHSKLVFLGRFVLTEDEEDFLFQTASALWEDELLSLGEDFASILLEEQYTTYVHFSELKQFLERFCAVEGLISGRERFIRGAKKGDLYPQYYLVFEQTKGITYLPSLSQLIDREMGNNSTV